MSYLNVIASKIFRVRHWFSIDILYSQNNEFRFLLFFEILLLWLCVAFFCCGTNGIAIKPTFLPKFLRIRDRVNMKDYSDFYVFSFWKTNTFRRIGLS